VLSGLEFLLFSNIYNSNTIFTDLCQFHSRKDYVLLSQVLLKGDQIYHFMFFHKTPDAARNECVYPGEGVDGTILH
jgi:hypothetical protein